MQSSKKSVTLTPSWKAFIRSYAVAILLSPLLIGFYLIWKTYRQQHNTSYIITERMVTIVEGHISQNIDVVNIRKAVSGSLRFDVGTVTIYTDTKKIELNGLLNPAATAKSLEQAAEAERQRLQTEKESKPKKTTHSTPGTINRLDYLTGLWQQGLLTEEDFKAEKENLG